MDILPSGRTWTERDNSELRQTLISMESPTPIRYSAATPVSAMGGASMGVLLQATRKRSVIATWIKLNTFFIFAPGQDIEDIWVLDYFFRIQGNTGLMYPFAQQNYLYSLNHN